MNLENLICTPKHLATMLYMLKEGESLPSVANQAADQAVPAFSM